MPKLTPHEKYGDFTKEDEKDAREFFSYAPSHELEIAIASVKKFFSNEEVEEE